MFNYLSEGIENRSGSHSDEDIRKLIIEIATNDGFLNIGCSLSIFIMKSNAIENMWQDQNDSKKQHDGKVTIHEACNFATVQSINPGHTGNGSNLISSCQRLNTSDWDRPQNCPKAQ
mmetsp:Transcript_31816/g.66684  ORF Transcript_31816/g.66684 Transcript_31816/m.66684 type:complete len:117 (-) Transcript_31816:2270-2620(-)